MPKPYSSTKKKEAAGFRWLEAYIRRKLPGASLTATMNKSRECAEAIADAVLNYGNKQYAIEMKVIGKAIPTNIRLTHQTVSKARGKDLIVALLYNFDTRHKEVKFFRLGAMTDSIQIEPHFIVQKGALNKRGALHNMDALVDMLIDDPVPLDFSSLHWRSERNDWRLKIEWEEQVASPAQGPI